MYRNKHVIGDASGWKSPSKWFGLVQSGGSKKIFAFFRLIYITVLLDRLSIMNRRGNQVRKSGKKKRYFTGVTASFSKFYEWLRSGSVYRSGSVWKKSKNRL